MSQKKTFLNSTRKNETAEIIDPEKVCTTVEVSHTKCEYFFRDKSSPNNKAEQCMQKKGNKTPASTITQKHTKYSPVVSYFAFYLLAVPCMMRVCSLYQPLAKYVMHICDGREALVYKK